MIYDILFIKVQIPLRQCKNNLGLMLKEVVERNIDGEAINWAFNRLKKERGEKNTHGDIDGAPVDDQLCQ